MDTSPKFSFKGINWKKIGIWALMAIAGTLLTYVADLIPTIDFGIYTPIVVAGFSILSNIARKWITETK